MGFEEALERAFALVLDKVLEFSFPIVTNLDPNFLVALSFSQS